MLHALVVTQLPARVEVHNSKMCGTSDKKRGKRDRLGTVPASCYLDIKVHRYRSGQLA